eukprot:ANDGO_00245.mRNA.1 hypothetical protein
MFAPKSWYPPQVLNEPQKTVQSAEQGGSEAAVSGSDIAKRLKSLTNKLKGAAVDVDRGVVDYASLASSDVYADLVCTAQELAHVKSPAECGSSTEERTAFFLNLYNVLVMHGIIALQIKNTVLEIPTFFRGIAYRIGDLTFTPDDIEHGILRANRPHPSASKKAVAYFCKDDPRKSYALDTMDPRIHTALVCGSKSCPPIRFYAAEQLEDQLSMASTNFFTNSFLVDKDAKTVRLSMIFKWYGSDFGGLEGVLDWGARELHEDRTVLATFNVEYVDYDWSLNH